MVNEDDLENIEDYFSTMTKNLASKIQIEKARLLKLRIEERVKEDVDYLEEGQRRFPRIARTYQNHDRSEHWYWNDGSKDGIHLISFYQDQDIDFLNKENDYKISIGFKYK